MPNAAAAIARLCDPASKVSAHWLVDEDGSVLALVPECRRAWHAGVSGWQGRIGLNDSSIGIEVVNPGHQWGYRPFSDVQVAAVIALCRSIQRRWEIPAKRVLGHSDVAPHRKQDPGELFPWEQLAEAGIGTWPAVSPTSSSDLERSLRIIGYPLDLEGVSVALALSAFQRRYRPQRVDGVADLATSRLLFAVEALQADSPS